MVLCLITCSHAHLQTSLKYVEVYVILVFTSSFLVGEVGVSLVVRSAQLCTWCSWMLGSIGLPSDRSSPSSLQPQCCHHAGACLGLQEAGGVLGFGVSQT